MVRSLCLWNPPQQPVEKPSVATAEIGNPFNSRTNRSDCFHQTAEQPIVDAVLVEATHGQIIDQVLSITAGGHDSRPVRSRK